MLITSDSKLAVYIYNSLLNQARLACDLREDIQVTAKMGLTTVIASHVVGRKLICWSAEYANHHGAGHVVGM